jgi:hypothetical protein
MTATHGLLKSNLIYTLLFFLNRVTSLSDFNFTQNTELTNLTLNYEYLPLKASSYPFDSNHEVYSRNTALIGGILGGVLALVVVGAGFLAFSKRFLCEYFCSSLIKIYFE